MQLILTSLAILISSLGLVLAITRIQSTNKAIASVWPDWEGLKSPLPFWSLLGLAAMLALGAGFITMQEQGKETPSISETQETKRVKELETEIARLNELLAVAKRPEVLDVPPEQPTKSPAATVAEKQESDESQPPSGTEKTESEPTSVRAPRVPVDPQIDALSRGVIKSLISGSVKPLEPIAHQSLLDQFTINPFNFSKLQFGLKDRLEEGYAPMYLDSLRTTVGTTHIWKIRTKKPGPDILERIATAGGKVTGFRFDGLN